MIEINGTIVTGLVTQRTLNQIANRANRGTMEMHVDRILPLHFQRNAKTAAGGEYGYAARSRLYQIRKAKQVGHQRPNVLTGRLLANVKAGKISATKSKATFRASNSGHFPLSRERRAEIETVPTSDQQEWIAEWRRRVIAEINDPANQVKRRRKLATI